MPRKPAAPRGSNAAEAKSDAEKARPNMEQFISEVRQRAYEIYLKRGHLPGAAISDWVQAEKEVKAKYGI
jgi:hypothetical protein